MYHRVIFGAVILAMCDLALGAESSNWINPPTMPQTAPMSASEQRNLNMVLTWWREVIEAHHTEFAEKYQAEDYIQHNPNIPTGRAAFVKVFSSTPPTNPIPEHLRQAPVVKGAKGDFVWLIFEDEAKDPQDAAKTYYYYSFDILRIQGGKIQEHWDATKKWFGSPAFIPSAARAPATWNTGKLSAQERENVDLATEEFKDMLQYGHLDLADKSIASGYIQHNPNVPQGREGFKQFMTPLLGDHPQPIKAEWKFGPVLTLANGPYVVMMWDVKDKDPADSSKSYIRNHFDVVRIEQGQEQEHWDETKIARKTVPVEGKILSSYIGSYALTPTVNLVVTLQDGHLLLQATAEQKLALQAVSDTTFFVEDSETAIEFTKDGQGNTNGLVLRQGGEASTARRSQTQ